MATEIKAIQCPKCGSTQKTELRPGDFRCESCGTEYFLDNGSAIGAQEGPKQNGQAIQKPVNVKGCLWVAVAGLILVIGSISLIGIFSSPPSQKYTSSYTPIKSSVAEDQVYWSGNGDPDLYLSADKRPVFLTLGNRVNHDHPEKNASYAVFNDVSDGSEIKRVVIPVPASSSASDGRNDFSLREFSNGDIYIIANGTLLYRVQKTAYALKDVTKTLFEDEKELVSGIAKIDYVYPNMGEGLNLMTNDGKTYFYYPVTKKLYTEQTVNTDRLAIKRPASDSTEKTGFSFSIPDISSPPDASQQLIKFQYRDAKDARPREFTHYSDGKWDDPQVLQWQGIRSYKDFTPGRTWFGYHLLYSGNDYVLVSYQVSPAKNATRNMQCLDAHTAAIVFTTKLEADDSPTACVRYKDGFALADMSAMYSLDLKGKLVKRTPLINKNN